MGIPYFTNEQGAKLTERVVAIEQGGGGTGGTNVQASTQRFPNAMTANAITIGDVNWNLPQGGEGGSSTPITDGDLYGYFFLNTGSEEREELTDEDISALLSASFGEEVSFRIGLTPGEETPHSYEELLANNDKVAINIMASASNYAIQGVIIGTKVKLKSSNSDILLVDVGSSFIVIGNMSTGEVYSLDAAIMNIYGLGITVDDYEDLDLNIQIKSVTSLGHSTVSVDGTYIIWNERVYKLPVDGIFKFLAMQRDYEELEPVEFSSDEDYLLFEDYALSNPSKFYFYTGQENPGIYIDGDLITAKSSKVWIGEGYAPFLCFDAESVDVASAATGDSVRASINMWVQFSYQPHRWGSEVHAIVQTSTSGYETQNYLIRN